MTYEELLELGEKIGTVSRGLNSEIIKKIKLTIYSKTAYKQQDKCAICHDDFKESEKLKILSCNHIYHPKCIDLWLGNEKKCPMCKEEVK